MPIPTRTLGRTNLECSVVGFGAAEIGFLEIDDAETSSLLGHLLDRGVNVIDTAAGYRRSEELLGEAIGGRRDEYILVSKCGMAIDGIDAPAWSAPLITATIDRALKRLRTDRIDVMLLHSCDRPTLERGEAIGALARARESGKIRFAGYSGDNEAAEYAAGHGDIAVIEMSVSICDQANIERVLPLCRESSAGVIAKRPLANAAWKEIDSQPGMYRDYARTYTERLRQMAVRPEDLGFDGSEAGAAWPELALRFALSQHGVHTAVIGTTNRRHLDANIAAAEKGPLAARAVERLYEAFNHAQSTAGEEWAGLI